MQLSRRSRIILLFFFVVTLVITLFVVFRGPGPGPDDPTPIPALTERTSVPLRSFQLLDFKGISNVYSRDKGIITIEVDQFFIDELEGVTFNVFVALGEYDYASVLNSTSIPELAAIFNIEKNLQHHPLIGTNRISVNSSFLGEKHSLLVTAQLDGSYSTNTQSKSIVVARTDPHIRDDINLVGFFIPTSCLKITMDIVPSTMERKLSFQGAVSVEAQNLIVGDYITGVTSLLDTFVSRIISMNTPSSVILSIVIARIC
jgi:hypothetical protein